MLSVKEKKDHLSFKLRLPKPPKWVWHILCDVIAIILATFIIDAIQEANEEPPPPVPEAKVIYGRLQVTAQVQVKSANNQQACDDPDSGRRQVFDGKHRVASMTDHV